MCANLGNSVILSDIVDKEYLILEFFFFFFFFAAFLYFLPL